METVIFLFVFQVLNLIVSPRGRLSVDLWNVLSRVSQWYITRIDEKRIYKIDDLFCQIKRELGGTYKQGVSEVRDENLKLQEVNY